MLRLMVQGLLAAAAWMGAGPPPAAADHGVAEFTGLGDLPGGGVFSAARGMSADGAVIVGQSESAEGRQAVCWRDGAMIPLGDLPGGVFSSTARAVSADGAVIAGESSSSLGIEAFRWTAGQMAGLGDLPGGVFFSQANAVSGDGSVIVGESISAAGLEGFRWSGDAFGGLMSGVGDLPGGRFLSQVFAVSFDGTTLAGQSDSSPGPQAFVYRDFQMRPLTGLLPHGHYGLAWALSGSAVLGQSESLWGFEACLWRGSEPVGLGGLSGENFSSFARAASANAEVVVGFALDDTHASCAFIWDAARGMRPLARELTCVHGLDLTGWVLQEAAAISADGRIIAGNGTNPRGEPEAWRVRLPATPPAPSRPEPPESAGFSFGPFAAELRLPGEPADVAVGADGRIYVTDRPAGAVRVFDAAGREQAAWTGGLLEPSGVTIGPSGHVYVADRARACITVWSTEGELLTRFGRPGAEAGEFHRPEGLAAWGEFLAVADGGNHRVQVLRWTGEPVQVIGRRGHADGEFVRPVDVAAGGEQQLYVCDRGNHRVQRFDNGVFARAWGGRGASAGLFHEPSGLAFSGGKLAVVDAGNQRVQFFDPEGALVGVWAAHNVVPHAGGGTIQTPGRIAIAPSAAFAVLTEPLESRCQVFRRSGSAAPGCGFVRQPEPYFGSHLDADGAWLAVTRPADATVLVYDVSGESPMPLGRVGRLGSGHGALQDPGGIDLDAARGDLLVTDRHDGRISRFTIHAARTGALEWPDIGRFAQAVEAAVLTAAVPAEQRVRMLFPIAARRHPNGHVYVLDDAHGAVYVFDAEWKFVHRLGGDASAAGGTGGAGANGAASADGAANKGSEDAGAHTVIDFAFAADGTIHVLTAGGVRQFDTAGVQRAFRPLTGGMFGSGLRPAGLALGADGELRISDAAGGRIVGVGAEGQPLEPWGAPGIGPAQFMRPGAMARDRAGRWFVLDGGNHRVQILAPDDRFVGAIGPRLYVRPTEVVPPSPSGAAGDRNPQ